jgi:hypothetical protein
MLNGNIMFIRFTLSDRSGLGVYPFHSHLALKKANICVNQFIKTTKVTKDTKNMKIVNISLRALYVLRA